MTISRRLALFMIVVNALYVLFGITQFFYIGQRLFTDLNWDMPQLPDVGYYLVIVIPAILSLIIYIGLFWVMKVFKEKKWVKSGLVVFFCTSALAILLPVATFFYHTAEAIIDIQILVHFLIKINTVYLLVTFVFVRNQTIRKYFWGFAGLMVLCHIIQYFGARLYPGSGYIMLLITGDMIFYIPYICILSLFVKILNMSPQQIQTSAKLYLPEAD